MIRVERALGVEREVAPDGDVGGQEGLRLVESTEMLEGEPMNEQCNVQGAV
jgi:hypothetical protein